MANNNTPKPSNNKTSGGSRDGYLIHSLQVQTSSPLASEHRPTSTNPPPPRKPKNKE